VICGRLLAHLLQSGIAPLEALASWRTSARKYQRRAVPVSMLALLESSARNEDLLDFIRPMMLDQERVVQQGLGWFLREAWKRQPKPVERFLLAFKDSAPRLIFQYATEKMTPQQKARFRRAKATVR
jgi:3-methyladenine DNA glycosylase AlkD